MPYVGAPVLGTFGTGTKDRFSETIPLRLSPCLEVWVTQMI